MATEEGDPTVTFTGETMEHEGEEHLEEEEGESSATNLINDTVQSNPFEFDHTEAQSTTLLLPLAQEMVEVCGGISTPRHSATNLSNPTLPAASSVHLCASAAAVEAAQGEAFGSLNVEQDMNMMNFLPSNHPDASSHILFPGQTGMGTMLDGENAYNGGQQPVNTDGNSYWALNSYQFPASNLAPDFPLAPTPNTIHLSSSQAIGCGSNQYPPSFPHTQSTEEWYPLSKLNMQDPSSTPFGSEEIQFQGLINQGPSSSTFYSTGLPSMHFQQTRMNLQDSLASSSNLHLSRNWISHGPAGLSNTTTSPSSSRSLPQSRNAVYDPTYESMGLPVDPHLRMFLARRDATGDEM